MYKQSESDFAPYFRIIYQILKFIDNSSINNKEFYSKIFRGRLSNDDLYLLAVNGVIYGKEKTKPLMDKYKILKHLSKREELVIVLDEYEYKPLNYKK